MTNIDSTLVGDGQGVEPEESECRVEGHDLVDVTSVDGRVMARLCVTCGAPDSDGEVAGYLVVSTEQVAGAARWISPRPRGTIDDAEADRRFWREVPRLEGVGLRLAKLVLVEEEDAT